MSRSSSTIFIAATLLLAVLVAACRSSPSKWTPPKIRNTAAAPAADAEVRPISGAMGAAIAIAEIDHRHVAIVADDDDSAIHVIDLDTKAILTTKRLDGAPGQILLAPNGTLFVAVRGAAHVLALRFEAQAKALTFREIARRETGDEPFGLALTPSKDLVLVTTIASSRLEAYLAADLSPNTNIVVPLPRDPRSIRVTPDGQRAFISHATGSVFSVVDVRTAVLADGGFRAASLDTSERRRDFGMQQTPGKPRPPTSDDLDQFARMMRSKPVAQVRISMKRSATQGFALAMIGDTVYLPETLVMTSDNQGIPTGYGSIEQSTLGTQVPFVARVKLEAERIDNLEFSGPVDRECFETTRPECIVPRAMTDDGKNLYIACLDSNEVLVIDPSADAEQGPACKRTQKERVRIKVESPTGVAVDGDRKSLVAFSTFSRQLTLASLDGQEEAKKIEIPRSAPLDALVVEGRKLFHTSADPRIAKDGRTCASCHVDGRDDALIWPTPLGKRQTPMLAGRIEGTAPYGWNGEHASLVIHIKNTLKNLEGKGVSERELEALAAYVASMRAPKKHAATLARETDTIARGRTIFTSNETGCSSCHIEDTHFTDLETHALGDKTTTPQQAEQAKQQAKTRMENVLKTTRFDTPSLAFVGQTAPYFHDGRFKTLEALIDGCDGIMGKTSHLTTNDRQDLVSYLRSL